MSNFKQFVKHFSIIGAFLLLIYLGSIFLGLVYPYLPFFLLVLFSFIVTIAEVYAEFID